MTYDPKNTAIVFFRLGWKKRMKDWSREKKQKVLKEISDISLERPITEIPAHDKIRLGSTPEKISGYSGLQLFAGMIELSKDLGMKLEHSTDSLVEALARKKKQQLKEEVL